MTEDEDTPRPKLVPLQPRPLETLAVTELETYIEALRNEITRAEAEITRKSAHRNAADAFFRKP